MSRSHGPLRMRRSRRRPGGPAGRPHRGPPPARPTTAGSGGMRTRRPRRLAGRASPAAGSPASGGRHRAESRGSPVDRPHLGERRLGHDHPLASQVGLERDGTRGGLEAAKWEAGVEARPQITAHRPLIGRREDRAMPALVGERPAPAARVRSRPPAHPGERRTRSAPAHPRARSNARSPRGRRPRPRRPTTNGQSPPGGRTAGLGAPTPRGRPTVSLAILPVRRPRSSIVASNSRKHASESSAVAGR